LYTCTMVTRRKHSESYIEQPVRFYKFIALTFLILTIVLLGMVIFMSSKRAVINITTKATPVDVNAEVVIGAQGAGMIEGTIELIDVEGEKVFSPHGTKEITGVATGVVTLHNDSATPQPLVVNTRIENEDGLWFRLDGGVTVPANGSLENVAVHADKEGSEYDIAPTRFIIPGLNESRRLEVYATSGAPMAGGVRSVGVVSQADIDEAAEQLKADLLEKGKTGAQGNHPESSAVYGISQLQVDDSADLIGKEVPEFTIKGTAKMVGVFYSPQTILEWSSQQLDKRAISDAEYVRPGSREPTVTFGDYDAEKGTARVQVFYDGIVTLNPESKQIEKPLFFGKTKDEVRRYLLSLDHVNGVDVELHPAWMRTVPQIHDHVDVIVTEVE